jgi:eukaryotic-like serine/threonine-protein kinase
MIRTEEFAPVILDRILKRFEREAKSLARLDHANIMAVYDFGEYQGVPFLVMQYLPGGTLKQQMGKPVPYQQAAQLLAPIARALEYAHSMGVVHRDVKPGNILMTANGEPMLTDFGIAQLLDTEEGQTLTGTGMGVGTPEYMAPEQWVGKAEPASDQYALGVVFYELVTGRKPYRADTPGELMLKQATETLPDPSQYAPGLPKAVRQVIYTALAKKPGERFPSMGEMAAALEKLAGVAVQLKGGHVPVVQPAPAPNKNVTPASIPRLNPVLNEDKETSDSYQIDSSLGGKDSSGHRIRSKRWLVLASVVLGAALLALLLFFLSKPINGVYNLFASHLQRKVSERDGMTLIYIPSGEFLMGSTDDDSKANVNEKPQHTVFLDAYWIDLTEVTNAMYARCVSSGACKKPFDYGSTTRSDYYGNSIYVDYPVVNVDWSMAGDYCSWAGRSLPTEAQWEKAARGTDGRIYPWGSGIDCQKANYKGGEADTYCLGDTNKVGSYPAGASPYGVLDMAGNVWEWVADSYNETYYLNQPKTNPTGPTSGRNRILRGGSWNYFDDDVRTANRFMYDPSHRNNFIGFRCALSP